MSLTGDRLQGPQRLQISRLNVPQGLVQTRSQALMRGAISQTHCNQLMLQQLLLTDLNQNLHSQSWVAQSAFG